MEKTDVVLAAFTRDSLEGAIKNLNPDSANLVAILTDADKDETFSVDGKDIPLFSFTRIKKLVRKNRACVYLICDCVNGLHDLYKMKRFLTASGVPEENIVNFKLDEQITPTWLANLRYVEEHDIGFFVTGNEFTRDGLNVNFIPHVRDKKNVLRGVNLCDTAQDLRQGYLIAQYVFEHVKHGTVKFVLIGLMPNSFSYDNSADFENCARGLQYMFALNLPAQNVHDKLLSDLIGDEVKNFFATTTAAQSNLNFGREKKIFHDKFSSQAIVDLQDESFLSPTDIDEKKIQILRDYIELCLANGAKPVGVTFPVLPVARKNYSAEFLESFRATIQNLEKNYEFTCIDLFDFKPDFDCFHDATHLNLNGRLIANALLSLRLYRKGFVPLEGFCYIRYQYFRKLASIIPKDEYNELMEKIFAVSINMIRRKKKIKVGFLIENSANWCGDKLYNYFVNDKRFEPTIFLCMRENHRNEEIEQEFLDGIEQFKSRGLNVVGLDGRDANVPRQDIMFFLKPYLGSYPIDAVQFSKLKPKTLIAYIPYGFNVADWNTFNEPIPLVAWKIFLESLINVDLFKKKSVIGAPRVFYSGYPRLDTFFEEKPNFEWKMARPDSKKIIWAPHWSIGDYGIRYATFEWNYQFMYEFAKAHPEISWVVKPHPKLPFTAVDCGIFPSVEAYREYIRKWDELPNSKVYTGAYYQAVFATSDGMIHDCGSFTAEYQYMQKPMIYLRRDTQKFNELGKEILKVSYCIDGKDLDGIAALMKKVFIDGNDYKAAARRNVYDKYLNYPKANGMSASEFIYRSIADEFKPSSE